jgi:hypothetical protein
MPVSGANPRRQKILLGVLVVVGLFAAWYYYGPTNSAALSSEPAPVVAQPESDELPVPDTVHLNALAEAEELEEAGRNPFAYGVRPPPPAPPRPATPPSLPPPVNLGPPPATGPPPIALKLIGVTVVSPMGKSVVTLKDPSSGAVFNAMEGDIVDGRYRVVKVGLQSVTLAYLDGSGTRLVGLGG